MINTNFKITRTEVYALKFVHKFWPRKSSKNINLSSLNKVIRIDMKLTKYVVERCQISNEVETNSLDLIFETFTIQVMVLQSWSISKILLGNIFIILQYCTRPELQLDAPYTRTKFDSLRAA